MAIASRAQRGDSARRSPRHGPCGADSDHRPRRVRRIGLVQRERYGQVDALRAGRRTGRRQTAARGRHLRRVGHASDRGLRSHSTRHFSLARPHIFSYALGWFVQDYRGQTVWMHTGSINGMVRHRRPASRPADRGVCAGQSRSCRAAPCADVQGLRHGSAGNPERDWSAELRKLFFQRRPGPPGPGPPARRPTPRRPHWRCARLREDADSTYGTVEVTLAGRVTAGAKFGNEDLGTLVPWEYEIFRSPESVLTFVPDGRGRRWPRSKSSERASCGYADNRSRS